MVDYRRFCTVVNAGFTQRRKMLRRSLAGVVAVLLGEDVPHNEVWVDVPGQQTEVRALKARSQVLATDRIRYHGQPVALVVAESEDVLAEAEALVDVEYEELPGVFDPEEALGQEAPRVHEDGNLLAEWHIDAGDAATALERAPIVVEGRYRTQFVDHAYLEPEAGVAWLDDDGVITIRASTQVVEHFRDIAGILGVPQARIRVIAPYVGGGFGGKEDMTVEPYLALLVWRTRRPVRMVWERQESLVASTKRHPFTMRYRTGARSDGTLVGQSVEILGDAGAEAYLGALVLLYSSVTAAGPYRCPNVRVRARAVYTNHPPCSAMRGFGAMQVVFGCEAQIDELARRLDLAPDEIRRRNAIREGDRLPVGQQIVTPIWLGETIDQVLRAAGPRPEPSRPQCRVGRGIASNLQPYGRLVWLQDTAAAWIGFQFDGSVTVRCGVPDIGGGQAASLGQIAAEVLGVDPARVHVHFGDSARTPLAGTSTATRQLYMSGNAAHLAATRLRDQTLDAVAEATGRARGALRLGPSGVEGGGDPIALPRALELVRGLGVPLEVLATFHGPRGRAVARDLAAERVFPDFTVGTHLADVEVDCDTGQIRVVRYLACHDVGRAINPQSVSGQICGGAAMGIGSALTEEIVLESGINLTAGFFQYRIPTALDLPDIEAIALESGAGMGPFGARGIGEPPIGPPAATIANAVRDAIGVRLTELPMTPERVLAAIRAQAHTDPPRPAPTGP